jgi:hypothetical protein
MLLQFGPFIVIGALLLFGLWKLWDWLGPKDVSVLVVVAVLILAASIVAWLCGYQYVSSHQMSALVNVFGNVDPTYKTAALAMNIGIFGFFIGLAVLIGGLVRKKPKA